MRYTVRLTTDKRELHAFLQRDPIWAAYAIGDLEPMHFVWCAWHVAEDTDGRLAGLVLLYRRLDPPILLTVGETAAIAAIVEQIALPERVYISAREEHLPLLLERHDFSADRVRPMLRMAVTAQTFRPAVAGRGEHGGRGNPAPTLRRLDSADVPAIEALIALGGPFAPDAFMPNQVDEGVFIGLEHTALLGGSDRGGETPPLQAVAGTHLVAPTWGVAALGNVYVDPAWRGHGYGTLVSSAVTSDLLQRGLLVVLNVDQDNPAAIHLYRQLGYRMHCPFVEGIGKLVDW
ncbi:MAG TPA: GNAT family N-acetyltransferase [Anaerolineae bacterium]|nr:GNAT family N-acetyltransferase [Anaerolineae bacterium]